MAGTQGFSFRPVRWPLRWPLLCAAVFLTALLSTAWGQTVQPVPGLRGRVMDATATLSATEASQLEAKLANLEHSTGSQIVILIIPTTKPEDIASYANRVANVWKIGRREVGDGILLIVAKADRTLRIEVAKTLEGAVPDLMASRIIETAVKPAFKAGHFAQGLDAAVEQLSALVKHENLPPPTNTSAPASTVATPSGGADPSFSWFTAALFFVFALPVLSGVARSILGRQLGALLLGAGMGWLALSITSSVIMALFAAVTTLLVTLLGSGHAGRSRGQSGPGYWSSGGSWGGGGSGGSRSSGFSSGGGGNFGGGGASGSW